MNNYTSTDIIMMIAAGVFIAVTFSEVLFSVLQIILAPSEDDE